MEKWVEREGREKGERRKGHTEPDCDESDNR